MDGKTGGTITGRETALRLLEAFAARAGRTYAAQRNFDRGPADRTNVSMLSPYVRHRAITESDVLAGILAKQTPAAAFKAIQEVMWRTYWKGWLEAHPSVWDSYRANLTGLLARIDGDAAERARYERAISGSTGIEPFDVWVRELIEHGYLHNHARMWFASIWIFTLELPWELGADFFMRHLLDGDPASNTLSWRWVGGRQTIGKTYLATRRNILHYTENRLDPGDSLARSARLGEREQRPLAEPLPSPPGASGSGPALLLLHDDDFGSATLPYEPAETRSIAALSLCSLRSPAGVAPAVSAFVEKLAAESCAAASTSGPRTERFSAATSAETAAREVVERMRARGLERVVTPYGAVGPGRELVAALRAACRERRFTCDVVLRDYDAVTWPRAGRGFFQFGKQIPAMLQQLGLVAANDSATNATERRKSRGSDDPRLSLLHRLDD